MTIIVSSADTSSGLTISTGDSLWVLSGGKVSATTVLSGAYDLVYAGGAASGTVVSSGEEQVYGTASGTKLYGGDQIVYASGVTTGTVVSSGGYEYVQSGGVASRTVVNTGGGEYVQSGGVASGTVVSSGGYEEVNGTAPGTVVSSGGYEEVNGTASGTVLYGGREDVFGRVSGTAVSSGGYEYVWSGGVASGTVVSSGGYEEVIFDGMASGTVVSSGGYVTVDTNGTALGTVVSSGGGVVVWSGGVASGNVLYGGGEEAVYGTASGNVLYGGYEYVASDGMASGTVVSSGGDESVWSGGVASGTVVSSGGVQSVSSGGVALGTVVSSGGTEAIFSGGIVSGLILNSGGTIDLPDLAATSATWRNNVLAVTLSGGAIDDIPLAGKFREATFDLSSDSAGFGTDIDLGPSELDLAGMCDYSYSDPLQLLNSHASLGGFTFKTASVDLANGFCADIFTDAAAKQLVVTFRGSVNPENWFADSSFATGRLTPILASEISDAVNLVDGLAQSKAFGGYEITLTGHSLGGAIAQILGSATGLPAIGFNAPGGGALIDALSSALQPAANVTFRDRGENLNIREYGDQVSFAGTPIGTSITLPNIDFGVTAPSVQDLIADAFGASHAISSIVSELYYNAVQYDGSIGPDILPEVKFGLAAASSPIVVGDQSRVTIDFGVVEAGKVYAADPGTANQYELLGGAGAPDLATVTLPSFSGLAGYLVRELTKGVWSSPVSVLPGQTFKFATGTTGVQFSGVDSSGGVAPLPVTGGFFAALTFASSGSFTGTLTETSPQVQWQTASSGDWSVGSNWAGGVMPGLGNDAVISAAGDYTVTMSTPISVALMDVDSPTATVVDTGTLSLAGSLNLQAGTFQLSAGGSIFGGTLIAAGGAFNWNGGLLDGVTYEGTLDLSASNADLNIADGLIVTTSTGSGPGVLNVTGKGSVLSFIDPQTFSSATINIGGGGTLKIGSGVVIDAAVMVSSGGVEDILLDGLVSESVVSGGGKLFARGGTLSGVTVSSAGADYISSGGSGVSTTLSGGVESVYAGGVAWGTTVASGGKEYVLASGTTTGTVVSEGGYQLVSSGGVASGTAVLGGREYVSSGGRSSVTIVGSGGAQTVLSAGSADGTEVLFGGKALVSSAGVATSAIVSSGGVLQISLGGVTSDTLALVGGIEDVMGIASTTTINVGGREDVDAGGVAIASIVASGGVLAVSVGGVAIGAQVLSGGYEVIDSGGQAKSAVLSASYEYDYGSASGTVVLSGAHELVSAGAVASGAVVSLGGFEDVHFGGVTRGDVIRSGGIERVSSGGVASGSLVGAGGDEYVSSGGVVEATALYNGGSLVVSTGGTVSGGLTLQAGSATIYGTVAAGQTVGFAGTAGTLNLDNLLAFGAAISGFGGATDKIDLGGFVFATSETAKWSQTGTSGTLTVHDGATSGSLTLIGSHATSDFQLSTDGHGGTWIKDPAGTPNATPATTRFTQAVAGLESGRAAALATVHSGGTALLGASPLVATATSGR